MPTIRSPADAKHRRWLLHNVEVFSLSPKGRSADLTSLGACMTFCLTQHRKFEENEIEFIQQGVEN